VTSLLNVLTPRRLVTTAVLLLAAVVTIVGFQRTDTTVAIPCGQPAGPIVKLLPCPGSSGLNQGEVGVQMSPGWQVDLTVDGTPIPRDQITTEGTDYYYLPAPNSITGVFKPGTHSAGISYYQSLADEASASTYTWSFTTH
jgi:hypothetical protein